MLNETLFFKVTKANCKFWNKIIKLDVFMTHVPVWKLILNFVSSNFDRVVRYCCLVSLRTSYVMLPQFFANSAQILKAGVGRYGPGWSYCGSLWWRGKTEYPQSQCFSNFFSRMPLSQYKTCTRTNITIQNMYTIQKNIMIITRHEINWMAFTNTVLRKICNKGKPKP